MPPFGAGPSQRSTYLKAGPNPPKSQRCVVKRRKNFSESILIAAVLCQIIVGLITVIRR